MSVFRCEATTYATWLMVWNGRDQGWWKASDYQGAKVLVAGKWQAVDWADDTQINEYLDNVKNVGVQVVIADLTNGWGWLNSRCKTIQSLCAKKGLKFCVAENSHGDTKTFESRSQDVWNNFAGPGTPHADTYFRYHGKPLIVCYCIRSQFNAVQNSNGPWRGKFNVVWASGEDSKKDKWGWQLEPSVASVTSSDSMFVTSAIKWANSAADWRKSLAWLDYNFLLTRNQNPSFIIVGSYDDILERNSWIVADTTGCISGLQMRDAAGAINARAYYNRTKEWITGKPSIVPGGTLRDGCYRIVNRASGKSLSLSGGDGKVGAKLVQRTSPQGLGDYFWLYHLGGNSYRIIFLHAGLSLGPSGGSPEDGLQIEQQWDDNVAWQKWTISLDAEGYCTLRNNHTAKLLGVSEASSGDDAPVVQLAPSGGHKLRWRFQPVLTL